MTPSDWQSVLSKQKKPAIVRQIEQEEAAEILLFQLATKKGQQGPSTAVGVPDLRSKQGEFQPKTAQSLRHSTACSASSHHTRWVSEPYTCWGTRPPACHAFLPSQWAPLDRQSAARPGPPFPAPDAARKQRGKNRFPYVQALGWKKCVQFTYCSRIPCGQTAGIRSPGTIY